MEKKVLPWSIVVVRFPNYLMVSIFLICSFNAFLLADNDVEYLPLSARSGGFKLSAERYLYIVNVYGASKNIAPIVVFKSSEQQKYSPSLEMDGESGRFFLTRPNAEKIQLHGHGEVYYVSFNKDKIYLTRLPLVIKSVKDINEKIKHELKGYFELLHLTEEQ